MADTVSLGLLTRECREARLAARVATALMDDVGELCQEPIIERIDVVASKLRG